MIHEKDTSVPSLADCLKRADETREFILKKNALEEIPGLLDSFFSSSTGICLIADENTHRVAGKKALEILEGAGKKIIGLHIFPGEPRLHAEYEHVVFLKNWILSLPGHEGIVPIAAGAGTVNDLVKRAAFELGLPYLCVPTAASVDGFTPNGAALLMDGFKQSIPCTAPKVVAADIDIIAGAPAYLASSGFGDLASKIIAGTDWIIAEKAGEAGALAAPPVDPVCWAMCQNGLLPALNASVDAVRGSGDAISALFQALAITGFAMQYYKDSRPVSGTEHLYSHIWEMEDISLNGVPVTHGHKVTIGTLAATAFTELFFADPSGPPAVSKGFRRPSKAERKLEVETTFSASRACAKLVATTLEKYMEEKTVKAVNEAIRDSWKELRDRVLERLLPYGELKALLARADCPLVPETIGLNRAETISTSRRAQMMRNKYCILDLAWDMGNLESILGQMENSNIYLR